MIDEEAIEQNYYGHIDKYQITDMTILKGKTLHPTKDAVLDYNSGMLLQHFDDNTFVIWEVEMAGDMDWGHIILKAGRPTPWDLYGLGITSKEEYDRHSDHLKSLRDADMKERRHKQYELLKGEFEGDN